MLICLGNAEVFLCEVFLLTPLLPISDHVNSYRAGSLATGCLLSPGRTITSLNKGTGVTEGSQCKGKQAVNMIKCLPSNIFSFLHLDLEHLQGHGALTPQWCSGIKPCESESHGLWGLQLISSKGKAERLGYRGQQKSHSFKIEVWRSLPSVYRNRNWVL